MRKRHILLLILLTVFAVAFIASNRFIKTKGYDGLMDFIPSLLSNKMNSAPAQDTLFIKIDKEGYEKFSKIRDEALERGIIVNPEDPWVEGKIKYRGEKVKAELRLKGKMTDHVKDHKWSFRVKTKKGKLINRMHRFSLQQPGTRNYMYEWVHQTLARDQGMMALSYQFVHVFLNKEDLGIYALEENFDKELALNNERSLGPIFRFDPDAYWEYRLLGLSGYSGLKPEYTTFQSSFVDPMRSYSIKDSTQRQYLEEALFLMNSFREGKIDASQALNIELFAKKYAILDLLGGHHSVDWSDVKFYYNPIQKKIEPIAYESFSARRIHTLIGFDKYRPNEEYHDDFHTVLFSDPEFYAEYVKYLLIYSQEDFMPSFLQENDSALQANIKVLNAEFAYKRFETDTYVYNAKIIRKLLNPEYPLHVFTKIVNGKYSIQVGNVSSLPVRLRAVNNGVSNEIIEETVVAPKLSNGFVDYISIPNSFADSIPPKTLSFNVLGEKLSREVEVFAYEHPETRSISVNVDDYKVCIGKLYDQKGDSLLIRPGSHTISTNITFPKNVILIASGPIVLNFENDSHILIKGKLKFKGMEEYPIQINKPQFVFLNSKEDNSFKNVVFKDIVKSKSDFNYPAAITCDQSTLKFSACIFENAKKRILYSSNSEVHIKESTFYNIESGLKADFSNITLEKVNFSSLKDNAISIDASQLKAKDVFIKNCASKAINVEKWSTLEMHNSEISNSALAISVKSGSILNGSSIVLSKNDLDIEVKSKTGYGISQLKLSSTSNIEMISVEKDKESDVVIE